MSTTLEQIQYGFDRDSRRTWQKRPLTSAQDQQYNYDALGQVNTAARGSLNLNATAIGGTPAAAQSWDYDPTGNWRGYHSAANGTATLDQHRVHDRGNRMTQIEGNQHNMILDRVGRMRQMAPDASGDWDGKLEITWDAWSRITSVKSNGEVAGEYTYDGRHRRVTREMTGETLHSYYNTQWRPVEERKDAETTASMSYLWGARHRDDLVRRDRAVGGTTLNETRYVLMDYFNPAAITDASGVVKERYAFSTFGLRTILNPDFTTRSVSECGMDFGFQGQFLDTESGLMNYGFRYYSSQLGRWTCKDPIGERGGLNLYWMVNNSPVNQVDHLGTIGGGGVGGPSTWGPASSQTSNSPSAIQNLPWLWGDDSYLNEEAYWLERYPQLLEAARAFFIAEVNLWVVNNCGKSPYTKSNRLVITTEKASKNYEWSDGQFGDKPVVENWNDISDGIWGAVQLLSKGYYAVGRFAIDITTPVNITYERVDSACLKFQWETNIYIEDNLGANDIGITERKTIRAKYKLHGVGACTGGKQ